MALWQNTPVITCAVGTKRQEQHSTHAQARCNSAEPLLERGGADDVDHVLHRKRVGHQKGAITLACMCNPTCDCTYVPG